ncbi:hypothetical protein ACIPSE_36185 [Streptomyces sp. NPDC090106]|uniref:hypothetical protein n=1 Tax=Streptomyces sp. NPDC090106 TaxID=3365946 RepID=UPI0037F4C5AF
MTVIAPPAAAPAADRRAGTGLVRTVLRLHRTALIVWTVYVLGTVGALIWLTAVTAPATRATLDGQLYDTGYSETLSWLANLFCYSFWAVAAWAGGSLIGRELESGTARLAWTQGVTPTRWLAAKLTVPAAVIVVGGALFVPVYRWVWSADRDLHGDDWTWSEVFVGHGPTVVAYGLCALAVGALVGLLIRRALPALGVSVAVMMVVNVVLATFRTSLWPSLTRTSETMFFPSEKVWQVDSGVLVDGRRASGVDYRTCGGTAAEQRGCLDDLGVTGFWSDYHPPSHFWPIQLVETGILLAVAALAVAVSFRLLRRRTR